MFEELFEEKTVNKWSDRHNFEKHPGKLVMVDMDYGPSITSDVINTENSDKTPIDSRVSDLVALLFDMKIMQQTLSELKIDQERMPLGVLSKNQLLKGYSVLSEIQKLIESNENSQRKFQDLSNQYQFLTTTYWK